MHAQLQLPAVKPSVRAGGGNCDAPPAFRADVAAVLPGDGYASSIALHGSCAARPWRSSRARRAELMSREVRKAASRSSAEQTGCSRRPLD